MALEALNCPNCGAPTDGIRCEYCGSVFKRSGSFFDFDIVPTGSAAYMPFLGSAAAVIRSDTKLPRGLSEYRGEIEKGGM